jgi:DNA-binding winged helix-turn-helix (wHTH) protein
MQAAQEVTFAQYRLDLPNAQLWRGKRSIPLTNKAFVVLRYLVEHAGQVVSKAELFAALWPETAVSDGALTFCIVETRKALGDNAKTPRFIETVHRRGYRFLPAVTTPPVVSSQSSVISNKDEKQKAKVSETQSLVLRPRPDPSQRLTPSTQHQSWLEESSNSHNFTTGSPKP